MKYKYSNCRILVFAKAPIKGRVKTRLTPTLSQDQALELHCALVSHQLRKIRGYHLAPLELWVTGSPDCGLFTEHCAEEEIYLQSGDDLGQRMSNAAKSALTRSDRIVIVGTDCPSIDKSYLCQALTSLGSATDVIIGPALDGGYVLIGLCNVEESLFTHIDWGSAVVLQDTLEKIKTAGLSYSLLAPLWDVDRPEDLPRLDNKSLGLSFL